MRADVDRLRISGTVWRRMQESGVWMELAPGVWCHEAAMPTWEMRARAGLLWLGPKAALFGVTAAAWWGLEGFDRDGRPQFLTPRSRRHLDPRLELHTTSVDYAGDVVRHAGLRVTTVTRTIVDLAATGVTARSIEGAIDSAMRMRRTSISSLSCTIERRSEFGGRGVRLLRELLLDAGGESYLERRFLRLLRSNDLPRPSCQVIHRDGSRTVARVDFEFTGTGLVVEVSGRLGHASDRDRQKDARRRNHLHRQGAQVLEFVSSDVLDDPDYVCRTVRDALAARLTSSASVELPTSADDVR